MDGMTKAKGRMLGTRSYGPAEAVLTIPAALPRHMHAHVREVTSVRVDSERRGEGLGSELMRHICREADLMGMALMLSVEPFDGGMSTREQLEAWYERFGFARIQEQPVVIMVRAVRGRVVH